MKGVGRAAKAEIRLYFTGGATAVLNGWRASTINVEILVIPEDERVFRELPNLKESLELNIEMASPADFFPEVPGWQDRIPFIGRGATSRSSRSSDPPARRGTLKVVA